MDDPRALRHLLEDALDAAERPVARALFGQLQDDEGREINAQGRHRPYRDSVGKLTAGYGRNLDDRGLREIEALVMLMLDIDEAYQACRRGLPWFAGLRQARQAAIANMVFNLGMTRFRGFKKMIAALAAGDYPRAADEALDSKWARQVGARAERIAAAIRKG